MEEWGVWWTVRVTVTVSTTAPINKKQKKVGIKYLAKILMGFQSSTPYAVLLGFFALRYLSLSREVTGEQRKGGR